MTHTKQTDEESRDHSQRNADAMRSITDALRGLRFGQLTIVVQDGIVIQIDRTERRRLK